MTNNKNEQNHPEPADNASTPWGWVCGSGYALFALGFLLFRVQGFAILGVLCVVGGMVVGSVGLVGRWYKRTTIRYAPLKVAMCACLILGIGGCVVDLTLPEDVDFPVTQEWLVFLVGQSTNPFVLVSLAGWILFVLGALANNFRLK